MGTNYYLYQKPDCETCGRPHPALHIGKSSAGWCFSLHVVPEDRIECLDDWRHLWTQPGALIRNEYDERISPGEMESIITEREHPCGLLRHEIDGRHCLSHGPGTWDHIAGEFS